MSNGLEDSLAKVLNDGEIPGRVSNQLLLGAIVETRSQLMADVGGLSVKVGEIDERLHTLEDCYADIAASPSLTWLIKHQPATMIKALIILLSIFGFASLPEWVGWLVQLLGG